MTSRGFLGSRRSRVPASRCRGQCRARRQAIRGFSGITARGATTPLMQLPLQPPVRRACVQSRSPGKYEACPEKSSHQRSYFPGTWLGAARTARTRLCGPGRERRRSGLTLLRCPAWPCPKPAACSPLSPLLGPSGTGRGEHISTCGKLCEVALRGWVQTEPHTSVRVGPGLYPRGVEGQL